MATRGWRISLTNRRASPDHFPLLIVVLVSKSIERDACMHAIAQFGAGKKSRNAANNECISHVVSRFE